MNKKILILAFVILGIAIKCITHIHTENINLEREIYTLLEKDELTDEEKDKIEFATDPDEMKEGFVWLDDKHRALFKEHFGRDR